MSLSPTPDPAAAPAPAPGGMPPPPPELVPGAAPANAAPTPLAATDDAPAVTPLAPADAAPADLAADAVPLAAPMAPPRVVARTLPVARPAPVPFRAAEPLTCPACRHVLDPRQTNTGSPLPCPQCHRQRQVDVLPAYFRDLPAGREHEPAQEGEASCFHHPDARAEVVCDQCGRFLCPTCDLSTAGRHLCPPCLTRLVTVEQPSQFITQLVNWNGLAFLILAATLVACLLPAIVTAPLAIYCVVRGRRARTAPLRPSTLYAVLAVLLAVIELAGWIGSVTYLIYAGVHGRL